MRNIKSYLITDPNYFSDNKEIFKEKLIAVLKNHKIDFACFRDKSSKNIEELAKIFLQICKEFKIENILINSNISLAIKLGFDGIHLNSQQFDKIENAKKSKLITIISCHNLEELEQALIYNEEIKVLDLLLYKNDRFIIVDYKTTTEVLYSHKTQVEYYKKAVSEIFNIKNVDGYLVYLKEDSIEFFEV